MQCRRLRIQVLAGGARDLPAPRPKRRPGLHVHALRLTLLLPLATPGAAAAGAQSGLLDPIGAARGDVGQLRSPDRPRIRPLIRHRQEPTPLHLTTDSPDQTLALEIARAWMADTPAQSLPWSWGQAVLMLGFQSVHQATQDPGVLQYLQDWIDFHLARGISIHSSDTLVPCTSAQYLYYLFREDRYLLPVEQGRHYLEHEAPRLSDGAIAHLKIAPNQIWEDSLMMVGSFLTLDGALLGESEAFDEAALQFQLFSRHLRSDSSDLFFHMYDELVDQTLPSAPVFWGRGNGWVLASLALLLTALPPDHAERAGLEAQFIAHAEAVQEWQDSSGLWFTVLNQPDRHGNYLETSAAALNTFGLLRGFRLGLLDARALDAAERGLAGVRSRIVYDAQGSPTVTGISVGTNPGPYAYYVHIPVADDQTYGIGAVLLALQEGAR